MDGIHDLGGKHGFGDVIDAATYNTNEKTAPAFPERWQAVVFAMTRALGVNGITHNTDQFRHAIERIDPVSYLNDGYYGRWLGAIETLLVEAGQLTQTQVRDRLAELHPDHAEDRVAARPDNKPDAFSSERADRSTARRSLSSNPLFALGAQVVTNAAASLGHTRLPAYARGVCGTVVAQHGGWIYPDTNAHGLGEQPQHLYTVEFNGVDLWGANTEPGLTVCLDLFEAYLEGVEDHG